MPEKGKIKISEELYRKLNTSRLQASFYMSKKVTEFLNNIFLGIGVQLTLKKWGEGDGILGNIEAKYSIQGV